MRPTQSILEYDRALSEYLPSSTATNTPRNISFSCKRARNVIQDILKDKEADRHSLGGL